MKPTKKEESNAKYYKVSEMTPEEMVEDFFYQQEKAEHDALIEDGWEVVGVTDKNTTPEELDELFDKLADDMD